MLFYREKNLEKVGITELEDRRKGANLSGIGHMSAVAPETIVL